MIVKQLAMTLALALAVGVTASGCGGKRFASKAPDKTMSCSACGETYPVTQEDLLKIDYKTAEQDEDGVYIVECLKCGEVGATLNVSESTNGEEETDE